MIKCHIFAKRFIKMCEFNDQWKEALKLAIETAFRPLCVCHQCVTSESRAVDDTVERICSFIDQYEIGRK